MMTQVTVGVLGISSCFLFEALQGAFIEHINILKTLPQVVRIIQVRKPQDLMQVDAIIIPGGESTSISLLIEKAGLFNPLREWVANDKPVWGTCAGMILLADEAHNMKEGGQKLVGGLGVTIRRNTFGAQLESFMSDLPVKGLDGPFPGVFIRGPSVEKINHEKVEILSSFQRKGLDTSEEDIIVAVKQGNILATAFHPELTQDYRIHELFVSSVIHYKTMQID